MSLPLIILLVGLAYGVLVGGLSIFRREALSLRFAVEAATITVIVSGLAAITGWPVNPVLFVILLYLLTMRIRILVDLGSGFTRQRKYSLAGKLFAFAARLWPDAINELILKVNQATLFMQENKLDESIAMFTDVLHKAGQGNLGVKYEAAAHFNLGVAYQRKNLSGRATAEFNAVIDTWPASLFAQRAQEALNRQCSRDNREPE